MIRRVEATYSHGVLKPDESLELAESARVRLTIEPIGQEPIEREPIEREPIGQWSPEKALAALESITARLEARPIHGGGIRFTRDELHERR